MSDIKIIKVSNGGGAKVDSSGFFIKPKQPEPSQLSQFIQKENERERKKEYDDDDKDSVDSMTVSDVSSATQQSHEDDEYTNESITPTPTPLPVPSQYQTPTQTQKVSSIVRDETLNSYLEKPKVELPRMDSSESATASIPVSAPISSNAQLNNLTVNEEENNNNAKSTTAQPANNRNDYYSDAEEDVIDMTDNKLYDILSSVLEDEDGENVSENMAKMNRNLEKVITMFEAYQQNNTKDEYLSKIGEAIENQNKILSQIVRVLEKQGQSNQETNIKENNIENLNKENEKKHKKHEKSVSSESSESSVESAKDENTDDTEKNPNIKKVRISNSIKHSTSKDLPLRHRIQIKKKT
jgi:hypothetical protein